MDGCSGGRRGWISMLSVAVFVYRKSPELRFLLLEGDRGLDLGPATMDIVDGEERSATVRRLMGDIGLGDAVLRVEDLEHVLTYYASETKFEQRVFGVEVVPGEEPVERKGSVPMRWASFEKAMRDLTLTAHRKALVRLLSEVVDPEAPLAHTSMEEFDHVPVEARSGLVVLCDFDGTVTEEEASIGLLKTFAPEAWETYEEAWLRKELSTHECLGLQFTIIRAPMEELRQFAAENNRLRAGFPEFVQWCREKGHGLVITSSGMDFYIKAILERHGLGGVPFLSNRCLWSRERGLLIEEGLVNPECGSCGNCKTLLVETYQAHGARVAFVGDGITDECPAASADMVFARRSLLEHCREKGLDCSPFEDFDDVRKGLEGP